MRGLWGERGMSGEGNIEHPPRRRDGGVPGVSHGRDARATIYAASSAESVNQTVHPA